MICNAVLPLRRWPLTSPVRTTDCDNIFIDANFFAVGTLAHRMALWSALAQIHNLTRLGRNALVITDTELSARTAPAKTRDSSKPSAG
jgi:hypothetical protein